MPAEQVTVKDLKEDQKKLKEELDQLEGYFDKDRKTIKKPQTTTVPEKLDTETLRQHLEENRKVMEKFDYLIDILIKSTEGDGEEELEKVVLTMAKTQEHALKVLTEVKNMVEKTDSQMTTQQELKNFEKEQRDRYNQLNQKVNLLIERVEKPPYLNELDAIRVGVLNMMTELKRLEDQGIIKPEVKAKAAQVQQRVDRVQRTVQQAPRVGQEKVIEHEVNEMNTKVNELEKSLQQIVKEKKEMNTQE